MNERSLPLSGRTAKEPPPGGSFAFLFPGGGIIKRKKRSPRRKTIFTIPPALAGGLYIYLTPSGVRYYLSLAVRPEIIKRKKKKGSAGKQSLFTPPPPGGWIIKVKKERSRRKEIFTIPPAAAGGLYIYLTPSGVRYYLSLAVRPEIIKLKKRKAQWAVLFFEFN